jgi:hypothetical protein
MARVKGSTRAERDAARAEVRRQRSLQFARQQGERAAWSGQELLYTACDRAQKVARDLTETGQRTLAAAIVQAVEQLDTPQNRK